jgi:hypothetical protein
MSFSLRPKRKAMHDPVAALKPAHGDEDAGDDQSSSSNAEGGDGAPNDADEAVADFLSSDFFD